MQKNLTVLAKSRQFVADKYAKAGVLVGLGMASASAFADVETLFDEIDIAGVSTKITAVAVLIVGIAFVIKGPSIVKRVISKI